MEWLTHNTLQAIINLVIIIFTSIKSAEKYKEKRKDRRK